MTERPPGSSRQPFLQIKYDPQTTEGKVMELIKKSETNASSYVRDCLTRIRGYEVLENRNVSKEERIKFCTEALQYFHTQHVVAKIRLENEMRN